MEEIQRMQEHLLLIRRSIGWSADFLGEQIGVTRQTINNIESGRSKLTKTQYLAMRSIFDAEMAQSPEDTEMLRLLLTVLVDHPEKLTDQERQELIEKGNLISPAVVTGSASRKKVSEEFLRTAASIATLAQISSLLSPLMLPSVAVSGWLTHSLLSTKKKAKGNRPKEQKP
jgi:DNA-binding XRE family transcriptional regulator